MDEPTDLTKAQRQRADALVIAGRLLSTKPSMFGASGIGDDRSTTDLTDLAQFILTGKHPLEDWRNTAAEREFAPPINFPRLTNIRDLTEFHDAQVRLGVVADTDESTPGENPVDEQKED